MRHQSRHPQVEVGQGLGVDLAEILGLDAQVRVDRRVINLVRGLAAHGLAVFFCLVRRDDALDLQQKVVGQHGQIGRVEVLQHVLRQVHVGVPVGVDRAGHEGLPPLCQDVEHAHAADVEAAGPLSVVPVEAGPALRALLLDWGPGNQAIEGIGPVGVVVTVQGDDLGLLAQQQADARVWPLIPVLQFEFGGHAGEEPLPVGHAAPAVGLGPLARPLGARRDGDDAVASLKVGVGASGER